jgi:hypothetical protein
MLPFDISVAQTTLSDQHYTNKEYLKSIIMEMRTNGMSYRQIGAVVGVHWTRVGQILKATTRLGDSKNILKD